MTISLSQEDVNRFRQMGYSDQEIQQALNELQNESPLQQSYNRAMTGSISNRSNTLVAGQNQENLIKWQLELDSILERIEHILRGDRPRMIDGNLIFVEPKSDDEKMFNDFGVAEIMRILSMYLNRNTILSNYDEETILYKVYDFGCEVSDLIFLKYENMGLNTLEKRKRYTMIVRELVDTVHSAYLRALNGGERDSLRQARSIQQTESFSPFGGGMGGMVKERSMFNPMRWIQGKYARIGI